jgi:hypothetical protein
MNNTKFNPKSRVTNLRVGHCCFLGFSFFASAVFAQASNTNANNAVPARASSVATAQAINSIIIQNPFSNVGGGGFRMRLGENSSPNTQINANQSNKNSNDPLTGMAAGDSSNWSFWATPVYSGFRNNISPYTSTGDVILGLAGLEYNYNDVMVSGISLALDSTQSKTNYNGGTYKSTGVTVSPYMVYQINNNWMTDWSAGIGSSKPNTNSSTYGTGSTSADRFFASGGLTNRTELGKSWVVNPRVSYTYYRDYLGAYTSSTNTVNAALASYLYQTKLGGTLTHEKPGFSPFISYFQLFNTQKYSASGISPSVYPSSYQMIAGVNISKGMFYGTTAFQVEKGTSQFRIYGGIRF